MTLSSSYIMCVYRTICHSVRLSHWFNKGYLLACIVAMKDRLLLLLHITQ